MMFMVRCDIGTNKISGTCLPLLCHLVTPPGLASMRFVALTASFLRRRSDP